VGSDIGGFVDEPSAELFTRWLQLGIFHPLFRNHSMGYNVDGAAAVKEEEVELQKQLSDSEQEPWTFGKKYTDINRSVIELRYRLLHYLYTAFWTYVTEGTPVLRPLSFVYQSDEKAISRIDEFMFGDQILVSPVLDKNKREVQTYFPKGRWYDFQTNSMYEGKNTHAIDAPLEKIPFFIKGGTVLPLREVMQYTQEHSQQQLELNVYYSKSETTSQLYEDAGEGYDYKENKYRHTLFQLQPDIEAGKLRLTASREGTYTPDYDTVKINIIGLPFEPSAISADNQEINFSVENETCTIEVNPDFSAITVK
jgi:alpha-glucosidase